MTGRVRCRPPLPGYHRPPMRRRLRSAAFPLHRHSIPQLAIDGALVAAAYYLSYRLRFDTGTPKRYERAVRRHDRLRGRLGARRLHALPPRAQAVALHELARLPRDLPGGRRQHARAGGLHRRHAPRDRRARARARSRSRRPPGVMALFFLLTLVLVGGARFVARIVYEGPVRGLPRARRRPPRAHRRRRRGRAARPARGAAQPAARPRPRRLRRRRPAQARHPRRRRQGARADRPARAHPRRGRARRDHHRDPVGAGHAARARGARGAPARDPGAHAADRLRAAAGRLGPGRAPGARGAGRGHPRAASPCAWSSTASAATSAARWS